VKAANEGKENSWWKRWIASTVKLTSVLQHIYERMKFEITGWKRDVSG